MLPSFVAPVTPMPGERQEQFFGRAMRAMEASIPSINRRTIEVLRLWCESPNDADLRDRASAQFPPTEYKHLSPRCVFIEHAIPGSDEMRDPATNKVVRQSRDEIKYGQQELQKMVAWANFRIRDTSMFAALSAGHTPTPEEQKLGRLMPDVLGYAGPFYLGLLGDKEPKWAIYADEWIHLEDVPRAKKLQRRSPEVWVNEPIESRTMDPIAMLGAETPRLDSGMNPYSRVGDGVVVMRYSGMAMAGAMNGFIPGDKQSYSGTSPMADFDPNQPADQNAAPMPADQNDMSGKISEAVQNAIVDLMPTIIQAVSQAINPDPSEPTDDPNDMNNDPGVDQDVPRGMDAGAGGASPTPAPAVPTPAALTDSQAAPPSATPAAPSADASAAPVPQSAPAAGQSAPATDETASWAEDEKSAYSAMSPDCQAAYKAGRKRGSMNTAVPQTQNYSRSANTDSILASMSDRLGRLEEANGRLSTENSALKRDLQEMRASHEQETRDAMRYSRVHALAKKIQIVPEDVLANNLDFTDAQFEANLAELEKYAKPRDAIENVDLFMDPALQPERYGRGGADGGVAPKLSREDASRYARIAADRAFRKNETEGVQDPDRYEKEYAAVLKEHGVIV